MRRPTTGPSPLSPESPENPADVHRSPDLPRSRLRSIGGTPIGRGRPPRRPGRPPESLHFYACVLVDHFLLVAATTGLLYAFSFQAEKLVYAHELTVPVGKSELPVSEQVAAARKAHPEGWVSAILPYP